MVLESIDYRGLTGKVITPTDPQYNEARQEWNRAVDKYPVAIDYCYDEEDAANAIKWCRRRKVGFRIRSGGHNYAGFSTGNGVLVIDVSQMKKVYVDTAAKTVKAQSGANNEMVYNEISKYGSYPFPSGTCPTVGISGIATGGGIGLSCRYFGLVCDNVIELELVDYRGRVLKCNKFCNADLFWACRGAGGGNFGVVTSLTFRLPDQVERICLITFDWPAEREVKEEFLDRWQNWLINLDERMSMFSGVYTLGPRGEGGINGKAFFYGNPEECMEVLKPLVDIDGLTVNIQYIPFIDAANKIASEYPSYEMFQSTGRFMYKHLSHGEIKKLINIIDNPPIGSVFAAISLYSLGGAVKRARRDATAFNYRNAKYILLIQTVWEDSRYADVNKAWLSKNFRYIQSITNGSYVNFPYANLKYYEHAYYGGHVNILRKIKRKYDPFNVFRYPQSIRPYKITRGCRTN